MTTKPYTFKKFDPLHLAYFAGIVDGEGCFHISVLTGKRYDGYVNPHFRGVLKVSNTDKSLIDWLLRVFEGTESSAHRFTSSKKFERPVYDWVVTGFRLHDLCKQVLTYLVIKKKHCENMIKFRETYPKIPIGRGSRMLNEEILLARQSCWKEARKLNSRFHLKKSLALVVRPLSGEEFQVN